MANEQGKAHCPIVFFMEATCGFGGLPVTALVQVLWKGVL